MITLLKSYRLKTVEAVVNKIRGDLLVSGESLTPKEIQDLLRVSVLGVIPEEYAIYAGSLQQIHPAFKTLGNNLLLGKNKTYDVTKKYRGFFGGIRKMLKRSL